MTVTATPAGAADPAGVVDIPVHAGDGIEFGSLTIDLPGAATADPAGRVNAGADVVAHVSAPWAVDAHRTPLPTTLHVEGTTLVQRIDLEGAVFPVVADPMIGEDSCGWTTCTISFTREGTRRLMHFWSVSAVLHVHAMVWWPGSVRAGDRGCR